MTEAITTEKRTQSSSLKKIGTSVLSLSYTRSFICYSWAVISSYFEEKSLVSQQIDSFNEFVQNTMQELVDESASLVLDQNMQHTGKADDQTKRYELNFGQIYLSKPTMTEADGTVAPMFPNEARLRNLTYSAPLYIDMKKRVLVQDGEDPDPDTGEIAWREEEDEEGNPTENEEEKVYIGKVCSPLLCLTSLLGLTPLPRCQSCWAVPSVFSTGCQIETR